VGGPSRLRALPFLASGILTRSMVNRPGAANSKDAPSHSNGQPRMTGCLAKGDDVGTFKLTDLEKGPKEVVIAETTANLTPHLGHKVEITGVTVPGKDKTHTMKVTAVKMISSKCP
jgi:hypothetical protein